MYSFEGRIKQPQTFGVPSVTFFCGAVGVGALFLFLLTPVFIAKAMCFLVGVALIAVAYSEWVDRENWLVKESINLGENIKNMPTFSSKDREYWLHKVGVPMFWRLPNNKNKAYSSLHCWKGYIEEYGIIHNDGAVSIAFQWQGAFNRYYDNEELQQEENQRIAIQKQYEQYPGICIEHHFVRSHDKSVADRYLKYAEEKNPEAPAIVKDIKTQLALMYSKNALSNRVYTVISFLPPKPFKKWNWLMPVTITHESLWHEGYKKCLDIFNEINHEYEGAELLKSDQYTNLIESVRSPKGEATVVSERYDLSEQIICEKPEVSDDCLKLDGTYYKVCVFHNYPTTVNTSWFFGMSDVNVNMHVSQIILPLSSDKALDDSREDADYQSQVASDKRGVEKQIKSLKDSSSFRFYVSDNALPVSRNAYIVTFSSENKGDVIHYAKTLKSVARKHGGAVRDDVDLQSTLFTTRLPGMGRYTTFSREDHAQTLANMAPFTTYPSGDVKNPESIRMNSAGQIIGFSPSRLEVPHELVVAQTGGGKDTQFGLTILETYHLIRFDIVELGNSYQGVIEAIGGRYCRAVDQVINPLAGYSEIDQAAQFKESSLLAQVLTTQADILLPVFKGFDSTGYTREEEVVLGRALMHCYGKREKGKDAPILPNLLRSIDAVTMEDGDLEAAKKSLHKELDLFMKTPYGACFIKDNQYTISPVANAIDFFGLEGHMFEYFMSFTCTRLANNAMARGARGQIILNEYKVLLEKSPDVVRHVTWTIDRMGRKDWVGLTRISQGLTEIESVDSEAINSIPNITLLSRKDQHISIGNSLGMPVAAISAWKGFKSPEVMKKLKAREAIVCANDTWHRLYLRFPPLLIDLMNTVGEDKTLRVKAYAESKDAYERIDILRRLKSERDSEILKEETV